MPIRKKGNEVYVARDSGVAEIKGVAYPFHKGITRVRAGHALTKIDGFENIFEPVDGHVHYEDESATAAPGETRDVDVPEPDQHHMAGDAVGDFESMTMVELRDYARSHNVTAGVMSKQELLDAIVESGA